MRIAKPLILLKILAVAVTGLYIYAGTVILRTAVFEDDGGILSLMLFASSLILGQFMIRLMSKIFKKYSVVISWFLIVLPLIGTYLVLRQYGSWRIAFEVVTIVIIYAVSLKVSQLGAFETANKTSQRAGFIILASCLFAAHYAANLSYLKGLMFVAAYLYILAYMIIENQRNIYQNIFDKRYVEKSILPRNLRRFNIVATVIFFLLFVLLYNFKAIVAYILKVMVDLVVIIAKGVFFVAEKLLTMKPIDIPEGIQRQNPGLPSGDAVAMNIVVELLLNIIMVLVLLFAVYQIILFIVKKVPKLLDKVILTIKKLFSIKVRASYDENIEYFDETEVSRPKIEQRGGKIIRKIFKKRRKQENISDPERKIRFMYSILLRLLHAHNIDISKSDTTIDILEKTRDVPSVFRELTSYTEIYNKVRYGNMVADAGILTNAEEYFMHIAGGLRGRGKALPHKPYKTIEKELSKSYNKDQRV